MQSSKFSAFVQAHYCAAEGFTHTAQMKPHTGRFKFDHNDMDLFWDMFCEEAALGPEKFKCGLSEKPFDFMPVLGDVDLAVPYDESRSYDDPLYTTAHVHAVVEIFQSVIKFVVKDWNEKNLICFVLEKNKPYRDDTRVKHGFHLHFPYLFLSQTDQEIHICPRVRQDVEKAALFADIGIQHSGQAIDKNVCTKYWLMYGCRKRVDMEPYVVKRIFDFKTEPITLEEAMKGVVFRDVNDKQIKMTKNLQWYLPRLLSVNPSQRPECIKSCVATIDVEVVKKRLSTGADVKGTYEAMTMPELISLVDKLVAMLSPARADEYNEWMKIGWAIFNILGGCREGFEIWCKFSQRTTKGNYNEATCIHQWNKMTRKNITLGSLRFYAQTDNPQAYSALVEATRTARIKEVLQCGQTPLAKQLYDVYGSHFVCGHLEKNIWYEFKEGQRWKQSSQGINLRQRIHTDLVPLFREEIRKQYNVENPGDPEVQERVKPLNAMLVKLNSNSYKNGIMKECLEFFYQEDFIEKLDSDPMLLGFDNGVLDLRTLEFRCGKPDDFVSMSCGYNFKEFHDQDPEVLEVQDFLLKVFPDEKLRRFFIEYAARLLAGGNTAKTFVSMSGSGDNSKSMTIELIEKALGRYSIKFPTTLITGKRTQSSQACPELARSHGVRFGVVQEPDTSDMINAGILKELTGNDSIYTRGLFSEGREIKPMFKMTLICNKLPRIASEEQAIWNRLLVLPFESRFPKNNSEVPKTFKEQLEKKIFYRDPFLSEKLDKMKEAFMWLMFKTYKECVTNGWSPLPDKVKQATDKYRENNDVYLQFINECTKAEAGVTVSLKDLYDTMKSWFSATFSGMKAPTKNELRDELAKRWGPMLAGFQWKGFRLRTALDDEQEGKVLVIRPTDVQSDNEDQDQEEDDSDDDF